MAEPRAFRLRGSGGVRFCAFDDLVAVFNFHDWETHLVDERAARVLRLLARGPCTREAIERDLSADGADAGELVRAALDELTQAGLIEEAAVAAPR